MIEIRVLRSSIAIYFLLERFLYKMILLFSLVLSGGVVVVSTGKRMVLFSYSSKRYA